jgi:hypothetical protein
MDKASGISTASSTTSAERRHHYSQLELQKSIFSSIEYDPQKHAKVLVSAGKSTNQPINRPSNQSINQSTNQPINQSTNQPINQSTNQSIKQLTSQPVNQPIDQPINQSINQLQLSTVLHSLVSLGRSSIRVEPSVCVGKMAPTVRNQIFLWMLSKSIHICMIDRIRPSSRGMTNCDRWFSQTVTNPRRSSISSKSTIHCWTHPI